MWFRSVRKLFAAYGAQRGLTLGRDELPPATPFLRRGERRFVLRSLSGDLGEGVTGTLAHYTYVKARVDNKGKRRTSIHQCTVTLIPVPEAATPFPEIFCAPSSGIALLDGTPEYLVVPGMTRIRLESIELDKRFEIYAGPRQDQNLLRQLFAPTLIVWLTDLASRNFGFEVADGSLCCYGFLYLDDAQKLDELIAASVSLAKRVRAEALE